MGHRGAPCSQAAGARLCAFLLNPGRLSAGSPDVHRAARAEHLSLPTPRHEHATVHGGVPQPIGVSCC